MWGCIESDLYQLGMYLQDGKVDGSFGSLGLVVCHATCFEIKMTHLTYYISIIEPGLTKSIFKVTAPYQSSPILLAYTLLPSKPSAQCQHFYKRKTYC